MQKSIQLSSHNVANANTPGYSRVKNVITPGAPYSVPTTNRYVSYGQVGTGVVSQRIQRFRSEYLDTQIRNETTYKESWSVRQEVLEQAEVIFNEPSSTGVNSRLNAYWTAWHGVATEPGNTATRTSLIETGNDLAKTISDTYRQLQDYQSALNDQVARHVDSINNLSTQIADLNRQIRNVEGVNQQPNDLRDQRDKLLTELSGYINVEIHESENGTTMVGLGGRLLVMDEVANQLEVAEDPTNFNLYQVQWQDTGNIVQAAGVPLSGGLSANAAERLGGKLGGTLIARDLIMPDQKASLDDIAATLITQVNALHVNGQGLDGSSGVSFFSGTDATSIAVNPGLTPANIAAAQYNPASPTIPGDGSNALAMARLENALLMQSNTASINSFYRSQIAALGQQTSQAILMTQNQQLLVEHLESQQEAIAGVSLDEETVNMLQYQQTYQAAARVMTTVDEMIDTIVNRMGRVGL
jgi:flagellar hook-associated protein 1 FlgK